MIDSTSSSRNIHGVVDDDNNHYKSMMMDTMRINEGYACEYSSVDKESNVDIVRFFGILKDFDKLLWDRCTNYNKLSIVVQVFTIKLDRALSIASYDRIVK